ncbi:MAG: CorA family divalent cation transporter [Planctomycetota bacterium]|nr:CorA family divalent cation transporter [Planctomycetota bacterium]
MKLKKAIISAMLLDRKGGALNLSPEEVTKLSPDDGVLWLHLDYRKVDGERWLKEQLDIDPLVGDALMDKETRPRAMRFGDGLMFILRSLVTIPGADPEDLPVIRCWCERDRIVTMGTVNIKSIGQVQAFFDAGMGPKNVGSFISLLTERMCQNMNPPLDLIEDEIESIHDMTIAGNFETSFRTRLSELSSSRLITMQRFVSPQRRHQLHLLFVASMAQQGEQGEVERELRRYPYVSRGLECGY